MSKYLKVFSLQEKWETFKGSEVDSVYPVIEGIETLSQNPTKDNIDKVRNLEKKYQESIDGLDEEDREVLEDMLVRILYQASNHVDSTMSRWRFASQRAADKGFEEEFNKINAIISETEKVTNEYSNSGSSIDVYVAKQSKSLKEIQNIWDSIEKEMKQILSRFYFDFFSNQTVKKINLIERHIEHFQDNEFGEWLKAYRNDKNWTLAEAAKITGVSSSYIHRMEKGTRGVPSIKKLEQLADGYGIPQNEMYIMSTGSIKPVDTYISEGAFEVNGKLADSQQKEAIAELIRLVLENESIEAVLQIQRIQNSL